MYVRYTTFCTSYAHNLLIVKRHIGTIDHALYNYGIFGWKLYSTGKANRHKILTMVSQIYCCVGFGNTHYCILQTSSAIQRLRELSQGPEKKLLRIGIKSRGCSGLVYNIEFVKSKFHLDEEVSQEGEHKSEFIYNNLKFRRQSFG